MSLQQGSQGSAFDNAAGVPAGPTISSIDAPPADTKVAQIYATQINSHDPYIYENYIHLTNFVWSTSDLPGTVLFSTPITPEHSNDIIKYLYGIYNTWRGGFDYKTIIAGTAFHAGRLIVYRLPPNLQPVDVVTVADMTHFPYGILDVKNIEPIVESLQDQTQVMYHYKPYQPTVPNSYGGWFCIAVYLQLNTSSSGVNQINVDVQVKASSEFHMSQIIPPAITGNAGPSSDFDKLFDFSKVDHVNPYNNNKINFIIVTQRALLQISNTYAQGQLNLGGIPVLSNLSFRNKPWNKRCKLLRLSELTFTVIDEDNTPIPNLAFASNPDVEFQNLGVALRDASGFKQPFPVNGATFDGVTLNCVSDPGAGDGHSLFFATGVHPVMTHVDEGIQQAPPLEESFVLWSTRITWAPYYVSVTPPVGNYTEDLRCHQTDQMRQAIKAGIFPSITPEQCLLFVLVDVQFGLPVAFFKMYYDGYFTTSPSSAEVSYVANQYRLRFDGVIQATTAIPTTPAMAQMSLVRESESRTTQALNRILEIETNMKRKFMLDEPEF
jgi:hypothetical protein